MDKNLNQIARALEKLFNAGFNTDKKIAPLFETYFSPILSSSWFNKRYPNSELSVMYP